MLNEHKVQNIFVVGLDDYSLSQLKTLRHADRYRFHALGTYQEVKAVPRFPVSELLAMARDTLGRFGGTVDAIVGYWDFPVSTILPLLRRPYHLPGPSLEATLKCEHKYWSRRLQSEVVPELIPAFEEVNPFDPGCVDRIALDYPFWIKPVKAASSHLGFHIHDRRELERSLEIIRARIHRFAEPFNHILQQADLPVEIAAVDGYHCIAESIISDGEQCTLEGYVHRGEVQVYGVVDSIREGGHGSCFTRYQYPSMLPESVQQRMISATAALMSHLGYDDAPFNIEYYWQPASDEIRLLEINTRISKSHCPLFKLVDGEYHHGVMVDVALGRKPEFPHREGHWPLAAKFMLRHFRDGLVRRVPSRADIERVARHFPDTDILVHVHPGMQLSELRDQDSYSFELAVLFMGAAGQQALIDNYQQARRMLPFEIEHEYSPATAT